MYRSLTIVLALLMTASGPMARAQSIAASQGVGGTSFSCNPSEGFGKPTICSCDGLTDCNLMTRSGVCKATGSKADDTKCDDFVGTCTCTLGGARISPGNDSRPEADAPGTHAPKVRDHRARDRVPAAVEAKAPVRRDHRDDEAAPID